MDNSDRVDTIEIATNHLLSKDAMVVVTDINLVFVVDIDNNDNIFRMDVVFLVMVYEVIGSFDGIMVLVSSTNPFDNFRKDNYQDAIINIVEVKI